MSGNIYIADTDQNAQQLQAAGLSVRTGKAGIRIPSVTVLQDAALRLLKVQGYESYRVELEGDSTLVFTDSRGAFAPQGVRVSFDTSGSMKWARFNGVLEEHLQEVEPQLVALAERTYQLINDGVEEIVPSTIPEGLVATATKVEAEWVASAQKRGGLLTQMTVLADWSGRPAGHWLRRPTRTFDTAIGQRAEGLRMDRGAEITAFADGTVKIVPMKSKVVVDREKGILQVVREEVPDRPPYEGPGDKIPPRLYHFRPAARAAMEALADGTPVGKVKWA